MPIFALLSLFIQGSSLHVAQAGWISSGGELFKDAKNPWFLKNTRIVRYCVEVDQASVSASADQVRAVISEAFAYWGLEFRKINPSAEVRGVARVGDQEFIEVDCRSGTEDLSFRVGHGSLGAKEKEFLGDVRRYIGVTVRTDFDSLNLRAKGFIYIASDLGEFAYGGGSQLVERAWAHRRLLQYAVLHEIGHVLGIPHQGTGLMSEVFLDRLLNRFLYEGFLKDSPQSFFLADLKARNCLLSGEDRKWFGASVSDPCIELSRDSESVFTVSAVSRDSVIRKVGVLSVPSSDLYRKRVTPTIYVFLGGEQKVFTESEADFKPYLTAGHQAEISADAVYSVEGEAAPKAAIIHLSPSRFEIVGVIRAKPKTVFETGSWLTGE